jgi:hypothetical protein
LDWTYHALVELTPVAKFIIHGRAWAIDGIIEQLEK